MLNSLGYPEMGMLLIFAMFVFGPERLPGMAKELGKLLRQARTYGRTVRDDLKTEMGPEFGDLDLRSLSPKTFIRKHLLEDEPTPVGSFAPATAVATPTPVVPTPAHHVDVPAQAAPRTVDAQAAPRTPDAPRPVEPARHAQPPIEPARHAQPVRPSQPLETAAHAPVGGRTVFRDPVAPPPV